MNLRKSIMILCIIFIIIGCRENSVIEESLIVKLKISVYKDDTLQLFYTLKTDDNYSEKLSIKKFVKGSNYIQNVEFVLPQRIKPKNLRLDFSDNPNYHDSIRLFNISLSYRNNHIITKDGEYRKWFITNENIFFESGDSLLYRFKSSPNSFDPQIVGNELLNKKMVKLFTPDINERRIH
ncbi:hypothetical protein OBK04_01150 [Empedobacter falsenii]